MKSSSALAPGTRIVLACACIALVLLVIVGAVTIPFVFESQSILYKFGLSRAALRYGKVAGILAAVLIFYQITLGARLKFLDRIFALDRLYRVHRIIGMVILALALIHPFLIIAAENFTLFPFEGRYWPEFMGGADLILITALVLTAHWRPLLNWAFHRWALFHRWGAPLAAILLPIHIFFVSETFSSGPPLFVLLAASILGLGLFVRMGLRCMGAGRPRFRVDQVTRVGRDTYAVDMRPVSDRPFGYLPGQFAFIKPINSKVPREAHPFTISSTPSRPDRLQFVIRARGDWTARIDQLAVGDTLGVDGPFGRFSYLLLPLDTPIIMIAGGIGITPLLSMLRHMADTHDPRPLLLIWSNRTTADVVFQEEFQELTRRLNRFEIVPLLTRENSEGQKDARLNYARLRTLLEGWRRSTPVFICAPPGMVRDVCRLLKKLGFPSRRLYREYFQL